MKADNASGDIPIKQVSELSVELAFPIAEIKKNCLKSVAALFRNY